MSASPDAVRTALRALGIRNFVLGIHDAAFPSAEAEDVGRGTPYGAGGAALLEFARSLGFDGIQLGPQGATAAADGSPYDGALFSRNPLSLALAELSGSGFGRLLPRERVVEIVAAASRSRDRVSPERVSHGQALTAVRRALGEAWQSFRRGGGRAVASRFARFARRRRALLERDALHAALAAERGGPWTSWTDASGRPLDRELWRWDASPALQRRRAALLRRHAEPVLAYLFEQFLLAEQHQAFHERARRLGLVLWGDLQVGASAVDAWTHRGLFLDGYRMGAPPSRTNPEGQAWGYPVLDPRLWRNTNGAAGPARRFLEARVDRMFRDYDALRVDHPHGLVCPWVYRADDTDPAGAVRRGARLHESPDLADHPELAAFAIVRPDQLRPGAPRHADDWVASLTPSQARRYARPFETLLAAARRHGRGAQSLACEVLSTCPEPLRRVLERYGLGRFRVTQKLDLGSPGDVYRGENAVAADWILLGNHDTPPIRRVAERWKREGSARLHAEYLAGRLLPPGAGRAAWIERTAADPDALAQAKFAELFVGPAQNVLVYFTDLFGLRTPYNRPGTVSPENWVLRLRPGFAADYREAVARGQALDVPRALAAALRAVPGGVDSARRRLAEHLEIQSSIT